MEDFDIYNGELLGYYGNDDNIVIPEGVVSIGRKALCHTDIVSVVIPEGVKRIENSAFKGCERLVTAVLPEGLEYIGDFAFQDCRSIAVLEIPESVERIGEGAFGSIPFDVICVKEGNRNYKLIDGGLYTHDETQIIAYDASREEERIVFPKALTHIGSCVFANCKSLTEAVFPEGLKTIGASAFERCMSLKKVVFPEGLERIGRAAFSNCTALKEVHIPSSVDTVEKMAFDFCSNLKRASFSEGVKVIDDLAFFFCGKLAELYLPNGLERIGEETFANCGSLTSVVIPCGCRSVGDGAFCGCDDLLDIVLPSGLKMEYGNDAYFEMRGERYGKLEHTFCETEDPVNIERRIFCPVGILDTDDRYVTRWALRGFLADLCDGSADTDRIAEWSEYIKGNLPWCFELMLDNVAFYRFVSDNGWISFDDIDGVLEMTKSTECRAMLLELKQEKREK